MSHGRTMAAPWFVLALVAASMTARADAPTTSWVRGLHGDPLELARALDHVADDAVLGSLSAEETSVAERALAIRATPWLDAPTAALSPLATIVGTRDVLLAPLAMGALLAILERHHAGAFEEREAEHELDRGVFEALRPPLGALADDEHLRADLRAGARRASSLVDVWLAAGTPPS